MNNQRLIFEYSPFFILLCLALGIGYAWVLYTARHGWSKRFNQLLFAFRAVLVALIAFLLIGPIIRLSHNLTEKPALALLIDNSLSVKEGTDSLRLRKMEEEWGSLKKSLEQSGYQVAIRNLEGKEVTDFRFPKSDLNGAMRELAADYEGKNLAGIILVSDGIYNSGTSPLYAPVGAPVYPVGVGDTAQRMDLVLKNLDFNKIAYQGNQFPLRAEVLVQGLPAQDVKVTIRHGSTSQTQTKNSGSSLMLQYDFKLDATDKGLNRVDVVVEPLRQESNFRNNRSSAFVDVVEGKKKILLIAPAPHPDIKAFRSVVEKNSNYEFIVHIPGVREAEPAILQPGKADLVIFQEAFDQQGKTAALFTKLSKGTTSMLLLVGRGSNLRQLPANGIPLTFQVAGQSDEVTALVNPTFTAFSLSENSNAILARYPPVTVPFGKFTFPGNANVLLYQRIGSVHTDRPLLFTYDENGRKTAVVIGEGIWRWRLNEFSETEKTETFDEVFSKLIQYLSTQDDKRKFRFFPVQNQFSDAEPVVFESQVYNDLFEQVYGHKIEIALRDEKGKLTPYTFVTGPGSTRYQIGGLKEGVYRYTASTAVEGKREEVRGEFLVVAQNIESQNLTADFDLLRKIADRTGGKFYPASGWKQLEQDLKSSPARGLIHTEEAFNPLIDIKWVFVFLLLLVSAEWFLRKYLGGY